MRTAEGSSRSSTPIVATEAIEDVWAHVVDGRGDLLVVGAPGSGKSTVLRWVEELAGRDGLRVRRAETAPGPPGDPRSGDARAVGGLVVLDDADLLPAERLDECLREVGEEGERLLATTRPGAVERGEEPLQEFAGRTTTIVLEPWTGPEVSEMLTALPDLATRTEQVLTATAGLPWLVTDHLDALLQDPAPDAGGSDGWTPGPRSRLDRHVLRLLRGVPTLEADVLLALAAGYPAHGEPAPPALRALSLERRRQVVDHLWHSGLVGMDGVMPALARRALVRHGPPHRVRPLLTGLVDDLSAVGADLRPVAGALVGLGVRDARLTATLAGVADGLLTTDPAAAARSFAAAIEAGGGVPGLNARHAEALALSADLAGASSALSGASWETLSPRGLRTALSIALLAGQPSQAARIALWAGRPEAPEAPEVVRACEALALFGVGRGEAAASALTGPDAAVPGLVASPLPGMADAVRLSLGESADAALPSLLRVAASAPVGHRRELLPDLPMTLAALVALHTGDLAIAEAVLTDDRHLVDPAPVHASRVRALQGWASMLAGRYHEAEAHLEAIDPGVARDHPWAWALRLGLRRRQDDVRGLAALWPRARSVLVGHPVDLYSLLPLGELGLTAARMHEPQLAAPVWSEALALLSALGDPPLWSAPFHWYAVQAGILSDRPDALAPHARALVAAAQSSRVAATFAAAGKAWVAALGRDVDPAAVVASARALAGVGQAWEGARLAGHAAARSADRKDAALLLECARDLLGPSSSAHEEGSDATARPTPAEVKAGAVDLSEREREVAQLVLAGLTYQQIGETLFLSARTVEHHVARIRRRSGAHSRAELLSRLSITLDARPH